MHKGILAWLLVLTLHCGIWKAEGHSVIQACSNDNIHLPCTAWNQTSKYRYIMWFKNNSAIIKRKSNEWEIFKNSTHTSLGVRETLVLEKVQPLDSGLYKCALGADIGYRDVDSKVLLNVSGTELNCNVFMTRLKSGFLLCPACVTASPTPTLPCPLTSVAVSPALVPLAFFIITMAKVILCSITVWVCKIQRVSGGL